MLFILRSTGFVFISFLFSVNVFSQRTDYIVTFKKDTVYGVLKYTFGYPTSLMSDSGRYSVDVNNVDAYYESDKNHLYKNKALPEKTRHIFFRCLEIGRISLYANITTLVTTSAQNPGMITGNTKSIQLFAEKEEGKLVEVKSSGMLSGNKKHRKDFLDLISDNKALVDIYNQNKDFELPYIQYYIHEYNKQAVNQ